MASRKNQDQQASKLQFWGITLFMLGLLIGLAIPVLTNTRMGLAAHLEGVMNGMFLVVLGLIWEKLLLSNRWLTLTYWMTLYGSFANFSAVTIAAATGAGKMMPIAGGREGGSLEEGIISSLLMTLALAMIFVCGSVLVGLYRYLIQADNQLD